MILDLIRLGFRNVMNRRLRAWLTMLGIIIGVMTITSLILLGESLKVSVSNQVETIGGNFIRVIPKNGPALGDLFEISDANDIERIIGVDYIVSFMLRSSKVSFRGENKILNVFGVVTENYENYLNDQSINFIAGRSFSNSDKYSIVLSEDLAQDYFEKEVKLNSKIKINEFDFKVIGIIDNEGDFVVPRETLKDVLGEKKDSISLMAVRANIEDLDSIVERIKRKLNRDYDENQYNVFTPEALKEMVNTILGSVTFFLSLIALISIVVGAIGIANAMFTSVLERTKQIGIMKAVGARNFDISIIFIFEASLISFFGGIIGTVLGFGLAKFIQYIAEIYGFELLKVSFHPMLILTIIFFSWLVGAISGLVPAYRASKLNPTTALRYE